MCAPITAVQHIVNVLNLLLLSDTASLFYTFMRGERLPSMHWGRGRNVTLMDWLVE